MSEFTLRTSEVATAAGLACLLEASAAKPGNVSPGRHFEDLRYEDFLAGAVAIGNPIAGAHRRSVGQTVRLAVESTARWTRSNANLGIVLLLAPVARAALIGVNGRVPSRTALRAALVDVLDRTSVDDAREVYAAIRLAAPGGLGDVEAQDVAREPDVTLLEAMRMAAGRDRIASEYDTGFQITFETGAPALERARRDGLNWDDAVVETFLTLLASAPDTHISRRSGMALAMEVSDRATIVLAAGGVRSTDGRRAVEEMNRSLREVPDGAQANAANPGTTADLTAAAIFVALLDGAWPPR